MPRVRQTNSVIGTIVENLIPIENIWVLDSSGSMHGHKYNNAISAMKQEIESLDNQTLHTVYEFSLNVIQRCVAVNKKDALTGTYICLAGTTSLTDAIVDAVSYAIERVQSNKSKPIVKIFTDGIENSSRNRPFVASQLIEKAKALDIVVAFIGTENDVQRAVRMYSLDKSNTIVHNNTADDITRVMRMSANATVQYSKAYYSGQHVNSSNFYKNDNG